MNPKMVKLTDPMAIQLATQNQHRGYVLASMVLEGIEGVIQSARAGNAEDRAACRRIAYLLEEVKAIASVRLPGENES